MAGKIHRNSLKPGHKILWYEIKEILGQGGFGITYLAYDPNLKKNVAIKEYLPIELAVRERDHSVHPVSEDRGKQYKLGLDRFITEARTLAKFDHPNIVRVLSVTEANNTAYMVMAYEHGQSLQDKLKGKKTLEEAELLNILILILGGLEQIHNAGFIHRDIKPDNIFIRKDGSPVLIDFGSARQALGEETKAITSLVSPGYAPFEQYFSKNDEQGEWTDIYGLGATLYRAIAGVAPLDAVDRSNVILKTSRDTIVSAVEIGTGKYSEHFLKAIDHAIQFKTEDRPQTIAEWKAEFELSESPIGEEDGDDTAIPRAATGDTATDVSDISGDSTGGGSEKREAGLVVRIAAGVVVALIAVGYFMFNGSKPELTSEEIASKEIIMEEESTDDPSSTHTEMSESAGEEGQIAEATPDPELKTENVVAKEQSKSAPTPRLVNIKEFRDDLKDGGKTPVMVVIPAGSFEMGSPSSSRLADERPRHTVNVKSFAVSKYELTFVEYDKFAEATNRKLPDDLYMDRKTHPVISVKWDDAYYYVKWLYEQTGKKYRLLSESEWEYAASAGTRSPFWWGYNEEVGKAHCFGCKSGLDPRKPSKVGLFEANKFGLHDTAGNVAEWVRDCWHKNYRGAPTDGGVWEGGNCEHRIVRGGSYISPQQSIRNTKRDKLKSDAGYDHVGIRIARELD